MMEIVITVDDIDYGSFVENSRRGRYGRHASE